MDELLKTLVTGAPNFVVAIAVIVWASRLIEKMVDAQLRLVDELIKKCAETDRLGTETKPEPTSNLKP